MIAFVVDETHLRRLSPESRRELLQLIGADVAELRAEHANAGWDPEGNQSFPLNADEARTLVRGASTEGRRLLRQFCLNFDGETGTGDLHALYEATGLESYEDIGNEMTVLLQRLRGITHNPDAWLFNFRARDWEWDEEAGSYTRGSYFISGPAIHALREAFGIGGSSPGAPRGGER